MTTATDPITDPCVIDGMPDADYHADPVPGGSLSTTGAKAILRSPAHYAWQREHRIEKATFDTGHAVHAAVLGVGMNIAVLDFDSWRTKAAQDAQNLARFEGKVPLLAKELAPILAMRDAVLAHPIAREILERPGKAEQSVFARDPETGVWLRARVDWLADLMADLKTAASADPRDFGRSAAEYGYDVQQTFYQHALRHARGDVEAEFRFIVVEKSAPYLVSVCELDAEYVRIGQARMRRAIDTYAACKAANDWPGYEPITHLVGPPAWLAYAEGMVL